VLHIRQGWLWRLVGWFILTNGGDSGAREDGDARTSTITVPASAALRPARSAVSASSALGGKSNDNSVVVRHARKDAVAEKQPQRTPLGCDGCQSR